MSLLAHRPLSREPPLGRSKLRGAGLCAARSQGVEGLPPLPIRQLAGRADSFWRRLIRWSVGELFPGSGSEGGGGECAANCLSFFVSCLHHLCPMSLLAHRPLSHEPPLGRSKLRGAGLCTAHSQGVEGLPPSAYSATRRPRRLLLEEVNLVVSWRPVPGKWKRGRGERT